MNSMSYDSGAEKNVIDIDDILRISTKICYNSSDTSSLSRLAQKSLTIWTVKTYHDGIRIPPFSVTGIVLLHHKYNHTTET